MTGDTGKYPKTLNDNKNTLKKHEEDTHVDFEAECGFLVFADVPKLPLGS
ncbi:MAG TPA: hypothetical protein VKA95_16010 [Nitrososphaeraceae archaeon]|nr:hypothetical protein [Nitrososphaeraceae archaeon]